MKTISQVVKIFLIVALLYQSEEQTTTQIPTIAKIDEVVQPPIQHAVQSIGLRKFLDKLAHLESRGKSWIVSKNGHLGKYQFNIKTIRGLGFNVTEEEFLSRETLQDSVVIAYLRKNKQTLNKYIKEYDGQIVDSVYVTKAGILAAAHLVGPGGVISFFTQSDKHSVVDGNGVHAKKYIEIFSKYRLKEI